MTCVWKKYDSVKMEFSEELRHRIHRIPFLYRICKLFLREYGKIYYNIIDCHKSYSTQLKKYKGKGKGKKCFIIGNGPSLKSEDLEKISNIDCFASNRIFKIFPKTVWRPKYYTVVDWRGISDNEVKDIESENVFVGDYFFRRHKSIRGKCNVFYGERLLDTRVETFKFSDDICKQVFLGATVSYVNFQLAMYMQYDEIYLLGMDHAYAYEIQQDGKLKKGDIKENHFFCDDNPRNDYGDILGMTNAYVKAKEYCECCGVKVFNVTRGGALEVFERKNFDELEFI